MADYGVRERRRGMLYLPHIKPLTEFAADLEAGGKGLVTVPKFDPLDAGVDARALFLFEKPGPRTVGENGSGFISRNNDDQTAARTFDCMEEACFSPKQIVIWNIVPWWNGTMNVTSAERRDGLDCLKDLLKLLPRLRAVVLVGNNARKAESYIRDVLKLPTFHSCHPSPRARGCSRYNLIAQDWKRTRSYIGEPCQK